jgi:hypothetical protein
MLFLLLSLFPKNIALDLDVGMAVAATMEVITITPISFIAPYHDYYFDLHHCLTITARITTAPQLRPISHLTTTTTYMVLLHHHDHHRRHNITIVTTIVGGVEERW